MANEAAIISGTIIGCFLAMLLDARRLKDVRGWVFNILAAFAMFGAYQAILALEFVSEEFSAIGLFFIALVAGFLIKAAAEKLWENSRK